MPAVLGDCAEVRVGGVQRPELEGFLSPSRSRHATESHADEVRDSATVEETPGSWSALPVSAVDVD